VTVYRKESFPNKESGTKILQNTVYTFRLPGRHHQLLFKY